MTKFDDLDIFDPDLIYPSEVRGDKHKPLVKEKTLTELNPTERRQLYKDESEKRRINRQLDKLRINDQYVRSLERQVVESKTYLAVKDLNTDFNEFTKKYKELKNDKEKK
tara:strand:+ start:196 stop:525 length:330 start_codon:yes stop_codon:yes gene_type:complete